MRYSILFGILRDETKDSEKGDVSKIEDELQAIRQLFLDKGDSDTIRVLKKLDDRDVVKICRCEVPENTSSHECEIVEYSRLLDQLVMPNSDDRTFHLHTLLHTIREKLSQNRDASRVLDMLDQHFENGTRRREDRNLCPECFDAAYA